MNNKLKLAIAAGAGVIVGGAAGFIIGARIANLQAVKAIEEFEATMKADIIDYKQQLSKTGPYSTPQGAASVLIPEEGLGLENEQPIFENDMPSLDPAEALRLVDEYEAAHRNDPTPNEARDAEPEADESDVAEPVVGADFIERFRNRSVNEVTRGVTFHDEPISDIPVDEDAEFFITVRDPHGPYPISIYEFMDEDGEKPYTNTEVTWFEGDDVLVDSQGAQIPDIEGNLGTKFREQFGKGSRDPEIVYLRNERKELDFEVTKDERTYLEGVLHILPPEKEAASMLKPNRKMRESDDN